MKNISRKKPFLENKYFLFPFFILLLWLFLPLYHWDNLRLLVHDNLDSNVVWMMNLANSGKAFSGPNENLDFIFNGIPRYALQTEFFAYLWFFKFFSPQLAYFLHYCFMHVVAFIGMFLLLKVGSLQLNSKIAAWISLCFALLPFWPSGSLSVAGMPLLIWALINIYEAQKIKTSWIIVLGYNFFSSFFLASVWFYFVIGLVVIYSLIKGTNKKGAIRLFLAVFVLILIGVATEYRLFYNQLFLKTPSHRVMWALKSGGLNFFGWVGVSIRHFFMGQFHFHSLNILITITSLICFVILLIKKLVNRRLVLVLILLIFSSLGGVMYHYSFFKEITFNTPFQGLNFRFFALSPFLWYLFFFLNAEIFISNLSKWKSIFYLVIFLQTFAVFFGYYRIDYYGSQYSSNLLYSNFVDRYSIHYATINDYYKVQTFEKVKEVIFQSKRIACIGFPPEIARFNGYKTVGAYQYFIPKQKLQSFNQITKTIFSEYDWKSRAYLKLETNQKLNIEVLKEEFDCSNIVSTEKINDSQLKLIGKANELYIYTVI